MKRAGTQLSVPEDTGNRIGSRLLDFFLGHILTSSYRCRGYSKPRCSGFLFLLFLFPHVYYPELKLPEQVGNNPVIDPDIVFDNDIEVDIVSWLPGKVPDIALAPVHVPYCEGYAEQPAVVRGVRQPGDSCNVSPDTAPVQSCEIQCCRKFLLCMHCIQLRHDRSKRISADTR